jgi:ketosteroid isomerase-like protein
VSGNDQGDDIRAIEAIIARQFQSLNWTPAKPGDWDTFAGDFYPDASLFPAARPAKRQTVDAFVERIKGLSQTTLHSFNETMLGTKVHVFGNVAVALGVCEILENDTDVTRNVEAFLLIKDDGAWRIVSQAWDRESESNPIPTYLMSRK